MLTTSSHDVAGAPVSAVQLGEEILPLVEEAAKLLGDSEATQFLRESYRPGETLGTAFARLYAKIFAEWGVIVLDASDGNSIAWLSPYFVPPSSAPMNWMRLCRLGVRRWKRRISPASKGDLVVDAAVYDSATGRAMPIHRREVMVATARVCDWR